MPNKRASYLLHGALCFPASWEAVIDARSMLSNGEHCSCPNVWKNTRRQRKGSLCQPELPVTDIPFFFHTIFLKLVLFIICDRVTHTQLCCLNWSAYVLYCMKWSGRKGNCFWYCTWQTTIFLNYLPSTLNLQLLLPTL